jgi:hypothetical protein
MVLKFRTRIRRNPSQILILFLFLLGCVPHSHSETEILIQWKDSVATGLVIPRQLSTLRAEWQTYLVGGTLDTPMLGAYREVDHVVIFEPLVPLTRGLSYVVRAKGEILDTVHVPVAYLANGPHVVAVYPSADTLPENQLKFYIEFSVPMKESNPLPHVALVMNGIDTVQDIFLDLRPSLWNREGTMLTLWLDPGRIKRDLQPNMRRGTPLNSGGYYQLLIDKGWPSRTGAELKQHYRKDFAVGRRDSISPDTRLWKVTVPEAGSREPLIAVLNEPLDYVLLNEALAVTDGDGRNIDGVVRVLGQEMIVHFIPNNNWVAGRHALVCESRIEDLAGNNLNRLFDQDLTVTRSGEARKVGTLEFIIGE